jgi:hypothetical protein
MRMKTAAMNLDESNLDDSGKQTDTGPVVIVSVQNYAIIFGQGSRPKYSVSFYFFVTTLRLQWNAAVVRCRSVPTLALRIY